MKYWSRVSGNRWLVAKMFGVLMVCLFESVDPVSSAHPLMLRFSSSYGSSLRDEITRFSFVGVLTALWNQVFAKAQGR